MEELLRYVCQELEKRNIAYMLSGSLVLNSYSIPRFTRDIDIVIELHANNFEDFADIFAKRDCYFHYESAVKEVRQRGMFNVIDWISGFKIDFIVKKHEIFRVEEFKRRQRQKIFENLECWVTTLEDLILSKLIWIQEIYSEQQATDIQNLFVDNPDVDLAYIREWIWKLQLNDYKLVP